MTKLGRNMEAALEYLARMRAKDIGKGYGEGGEGRPGVRDTVEVAEFLGVPTAGALRALRALHEAGGIVFLGAIEGLGPSLCWAARKPPRDPDPRSRQVLLEEAASFLARFASEGDEDGETEGCCDAVDVADALEIPFHSACLVLEELERAGLAARHDAVEGWGRVEAWSAPSVSAGAEGPERPPPRA